MTSRQILLLALGSSALALGIGLVRHLGGVAWSAQAVRTSRDAPKIMIVPAPDRPPLSVQVHFAMPPVPPETVPPVTLGRAVLDFNHDGHPGFLFLIWVGGRHYVDEDLWCGAGAKYEGKFIFRVVPAVGPTVDTPLETLRFDDFIFAENGQPRPIAVADYTHNGRPSFNFTSYGACNYSICHLFTVLPSGRVANLTLDGKKSFFLVSGTCGEGLSCTDLELTSTGFRYERFDRPEEKNWEVGCDWDEKLQTFHTRERELKPDPPSDN